MKGFQKFLIIGAVLLGAGIVIAGVSFFSIAREVLRNSVIIDGSISPGSSQAYVMANTPQGEQLLLSLSGGGLNKPLQAFITGPDGNRVASFNVTSTPFVGQAAARTAGNQTVTITNVGSEPAIIRGQLTGLSTGTLAGGTSSSTQLQTIVAYGAGVVGGIALVIAGITMLAIGLIKYFRGRKIPDVGFGAGQ